jgi:hypothetical protein
MADIMEPPAPGMAAASADRAKPGKPKGGVDAILIRRAGNGFIVEKMSESGAPQKPEVAPTLDEALALGMAAFGGGEAAAPAGPPGMAPAAGPDAMAGAPEESGMPPMPPGPPAEEPGIRYEEGGPSRPPEDEKY